MSIAYLPSALGEVAEVGKRAEVRVVHRLHQGDQGVGIARGPAVVLADHADLVLGAVLGEGRAGLGHGADVGRAVVLAGVDPDRVAAQRRGGVNPFLVVLHGLVAIGLVRRAHVTLAVDHDQHAGHAVIVGPGLQILQVGRVVGLVLEELVDELRALDAVLLAGEPGKIEVRDLPGEEGLVQRPFRQRDLEIAASAARVAIRARASRARSPMQPATLLSGTTAGS